MVRTRLLPVLVLAAVAAATASAQDTEALWSALAEGGRIAIMRHALAPGTGDPPDFTLGDCTTQRNLSDRGREQAREIGRAFRRNGVEVSRVLTSRWCRCRETAELLGLAPVEEYPVLDSFFGNRESGPEQTAALESFVSERFSETSLVLVTHQVNITGLTNVFPASGEIVVLEPLGRRGFRVLGRMKPSD